jgi:hypothetical protein
MDDTEGGDEEPTAMDDAVDDKAREENQIMLADLSNMEPKKVLGSRRSKL